MRPFRFRLEGLLRIRKIQEDRCRQELGEFRSAVAEIDRDIQEIALERQDTQAGADRIGELDITSVLVRQRHLNTLRLRTLAKSRERVEIMQRVAVAQEKLARARQQREVVERLRERQYADYQLELKHEEQLEMDEVARQLHVRSYA